MHGRGNRGREADPRNIAAAIPIARGDPAVTTARNTTVDAHPMHRHHHGSGAATTMIGVTQPFCPSAALGIVRAAGHQLPSNGGGALDRHVVAVALQNQLVMTAMMSATLPLGPRKAVTVEAAVWTRTVRKLTMWRGLQLPIWPSQL